MAYNPFEDFNPAFTRYEYLKPQEVKIENPFGQIEDYSDWASRILPNGNIIGKPNTPETEKFDMSILEKMAESHKEPEQEVVSTTSNKVGKPSENAKFALNFFKEKGLNDHQAAGIVGNLIQESNLNTTIKGDGGKAFGIAQWHPDRRKGLEVLAQSRGKNISDLETQLEYVWQELNTSEKKAMNALLNSKNVEDATKAFVLFERPNPKYANLNARIKNALSLLN